MEVSRKQIILRGLQCRCPNCGHKDIFDGLRLKTVCPYCYMKLQRGSGWWLGPLVVNYGFVVFLLVLPLLAAGFLGWISLTVSIVLSLLAGCIIPFLFYKRAWGLWMLFYYLLLPEELPRNNRNFDLIDHS